MSRERLQLANSEVVVERGPAGPVARIERVGPDGYDRDYAGPLDETTLDALREAAIRGGRA